jgi:hypothetical protein
MVSWYFIFSFIPVFILFEQSNCVFIYVWAKTVTASIAVICHCQMFILGGREEGAGMVIHDGVGGTLTFVVQKCTNYLGFILLLVHIRNL